MKRAWIISDTHFGARSNNVGWLETMMEWFHDDFIPRIKAEYKPGDVLIHCGDVYDNRQSINLLVMNKSLELFEELSNIFVDGIYIIAGNHDIMKKNSNDISSLDILKYMPNIKIFKEPEVVKTANGKELLFMPWRKDEQDEKQCLSDNNKVQYVFAHANIRGLKFDSQRTVDHGCGIREFKEFKRVYSGHIHWTQRRSNVNMVGNPYQMTRSDSDNPKGFWLLDFDDDKETFYENNFSPKFTKVYLDQIMDKDLDYLKGICTNNYVDLYISTSIMIDYEITPIIDFLSDITKRLEVVPFETFIEDEINPDYTKSLNIFSLCEQYIEKKKGIEESLKKEVLNKLHGLYQNAIKE